MANPGKARVIGTSDGMVQVRVRSERGDWADLELTPAEADALAAEMKSMAAWVRSYGLS